MDPLRTFIPLTKVNAETRTVYGIATGETLDRSGEICDYESTKPYYEKWSGDIAKAKLRGVEVEAQVGNGDIGFVCEGQEVAVKLDAFPFTRYGLLKGRVSTLGRDAVQTGQAPGGGQGTAGATPQQSAAGVSAPAGSAELAYPAKVELLQDWIGVDGRREPVQAGMRVSAEIKTGDRKVISYLLSPVMQAAKEAGRER